MNIDNAATRVTAKIEVFARDLPPDELAALGVLLGADSIAAFALDLPPDEVGAIRLLLGNDDGAVTGSGQGDLMGATQNMQETQMSFNLQYLQLQLGGLLEAPLYPSLSDLMHARFRTVNAAVSFIR